MRHPVSLFIIALMTATTVVVGSVIISGPSAQVSHTYKTTPQPIAWGQPLGMNALR